MIITIDGPSGAGKGAAARGLAEKLGFLYFDTGAMYRALAYLCLRDGLEAALENFDFHIDQEGLEKRYLVGHEDVTEVIRTPEVTAESSVVSALPEVRKALISIQRAQAKANVVFEGRDMGTVVFPDADVKVFLTASPEVRAYRRFLELQAKGEAVTEEEVLVMQRERDKRDSTREISPLKPAEDAVHLDTSELTLDEVVARLVEMVKG